MRAVVTGTAQHHVLAVVDHDAAPTCDYAEWQRGQIGTSSRAGSSAEDETQSTHVEGRARSRRMVRIYRRDSGNSSRLRLTIAVGETSRAVCCESQAAFATIRFRKSSRTPGSQPLYRLSRVSPSPRLSAVIAIISSNEPTAPLQCGSE